MSKTTGYDAIVIGAGHNGLVAAATLAARGKRVCIVEKSADVGGMAANTRLGDGPLMPHIAHLLYNLDPRVGRLLGAGGPTLRPLPTVSLCPEGRHVVIRDGRASMADGAPHPQAAEFALIHDRLRKFAGLLAKMSAKAPPRLQGGLSDLATLGEIADLARLGIGLKRLGKAEMREFLRILLSNIHDVVLDEMADGPLAGMLAADAVRGAYAGPRSPGSVFSLLYRLGNGGDAAVPVGGMGAVTDALADAARRAGCDIRTGVGVAQVRVDSDRVAGVVLDDGTRLDAGAILSSAGPLQTLQMTGVAHFDVETTRRLRNLRCKGTTAKINLLLGQVPEFKGLQAGQRAGRLLVAPSVEFVERAFNPAKYGDLPTAPSIELVIPSLTDDTAGQGGRHVLSAIVSHVPQAPTGGWSAQNRAALEKTVLTGLEHYAPGIGALVEQSEVLTPTDIETMTGAPGGHWHHAEMGFDQVLTLRPANGLAQYRFAVKGLYLCGASAHPGGDVNGAPGYNSARQALKDGVV